MGSSFNIGFQGANDAALQQRAQQETQKQQQRAQTAALYWNAVQTPLPPPTTKDADGNPITNPAYTDAMTKREGAIKDYLGQLGPEQHASIGNRLHGLIFGPEHQDMQQSAQAAQQEQAAAAPPPAAPAGPPQSTHPFAGNPAYAKIQEGLTGLGNHLKAFAHPLPPPAAPDYALMASAPQAADRAQALEDHKSDQALALQKQKDAAELERAKVTAGSKPINKYNLALKAYADSLHKDPNDLNDDEVTTFNKKFAAEGKAATPSQAALAVYLRAKYGDSPTADQIAEGTRAHQAMMAGATVGEHQQLVFDDKGMPHVIDLKSSSKKDFGAQEPAGAPKSSQAPSLTATNAKIAAANATSKKLTKKAPTSSQAPSALNFTKGNPLVKSDSAQYTKVAEDANNKQEAYDSARKALASGSTPSSDQELIYSWVRSNVQGAGRMTQAEFRQAASIGSLPQRAQIAWERVKSGKLPPEMEQMLLGDVKRASDTANGEAADLRGRLGGPVSSQAPQPPSSAPPTDPKVDEFLKSF
jgi:hypothetical protein